MVLFKIFMEQAVIICSPSMGGWFKQYGKIIQVHWNVLKRRINTSYALQYEKLKLLLAISLLLAIPSLSPVGLTVMYDLVKLELWLLDSRFTTFGATQTRC